LGPGMEKSLCDSGGGVKGRAAINAHPRRQKQ